MCWSAAGPLTWPISPCCGQSGTGQGNCSRLSSSKGPCSWQQALCSAAWAPAQGAGHVRPHEATRRRTLPPQPQAPGARPPHPAVCGRPARRAVCGHVRVACEAGGLLGGLTGSLLGCRRLGLHVPPPGGQLRGQVPQAVRRPGEPRAPSPPGCHALLPQRRSSTCRTPGTWMRGCQGLGSRGLGSVWGCLPSDDLIGLMTPMPPMPWHADRAVPSPLWAPV